MACNRLQQISSQFLMTTYIESVYKLADPQTGLLSPGDARRLLQSNGYTWEEYTASGSYGAPVPAGSRSPVHLLSFLGYGEA
jgi:hypothetical protein